MELKLLDSSIGLEGEEQAKDWPLNADNRYLQEAIGDCAHDDDEEEDMLGFFRAASIRMDCQKKQQQQQRWGRGRRRQQ